MPSLGLFSTSHIVKSLPNSVSKLHKILENIKMNFNRKNIPNLFTDKRNKLECHSAIQRLEECIDLRHTCGYLTVIKIGKENNGNNNENKPDENNRDDDEGYLDGEFTDDLVKLTEEDDGVDNKDALEKEDDSTFDANKKDVGYRGIKQFDLATPSSENVSNAIMKSSEEVEGNKEEVKVNNETIPGDCTQDFESLHLSGLAALGNSFV